MNVRNRNDPHTWHSRLDSLSSLLFAQAHGAHSKQVAELELPIPLLGLATGTCSKTLQAAAVHAQASGSPTHLPLPWPCHGLVSTHSAEPAAFLFSVLRSLRGLLVSSSASKHHLSALPWHSHKTVSSCR